MKFPSNSFLGLTLMFVNVDLKSEIELVEVGRFRGTTALVGLDNYSATLRSRFVHNFWGYILNVYSILRHLSCVLDSIGSVFCFSNWRIASSGEISFVWNLFISRCLLRILIILSRMSSVRVLVYLSSHVYYSSRSGLHGLLFSKKISESLNHHKTRLLLS